MHGVLIFYLSCFALIGGIYGIFLISHTMSTRQIYQRFKDEEFEVFPAIYLSSISNGFFRNVTSPNAEIRVNDKWIIFTFTRSFFVPFNALIMLPRAFPNRTKSNGNHKPSAITWSKLGYFIVKEKYPWLRNRTSNFAVKPLNKEDGKRIEEIMKDWS